MSFTPLDERFSGRKNEYSDRTAQLTNQPSAYDYVYEERYQHPLPWYNPKGWPKKAWLLVGSVVVIALVIGIAVGVTQAKANAYPDYTRLTYSLTDTYAGTSFFDNFDYYSGSDPADGFVIYVDQPGSQWLNLTYASDSSAVLKADPATNVDASNGRRSVRITSKAQYNSGLFIFDVLHSPYACGSWPALWLSDPANWPANGEIDVMETVNTGAHGNQMTLHTSEGCTMKAKRKETGSILEKNCWNETNSNSGCGVNGRKATYGEEFNNNGGGVYAMEWRTAGIRVWFFDRDSIPSDIDTSTSSASTVVPDPSTWGTPLADFPSTDCDINTHFRNQSIIANIDFCGGWASSPHYYSNIADCPGSCETYVAGNGAAFSTAYWEFKSFRVYTAT